MMEQRKALTIPFTLRKDNLVPWTAVTGCKVTRQNSQHRNGSVMIDCSRAAMISAEMMRRKPLLLLTDVLKTEPGKAFVERMKNERTRSSRQRGATRQKPPVKACGEKKLHVTETKSIGRRNSTPSRTQRSGSQSSTRSSLRRRLQPESDEVDKDTEEVKSDEVCKDEDKFSEVVDCGLSVSWEPSEDAASCDEFASAGIRDKKTEPEKDVQHNLRRKRKDSGTQCNGTSSPKRQRGSVLCLTGEDAGGEEVTPVAHTDDTVEDAELETLDSNILQFTVGGDEHTQVLLPVNPPSSNAANIIKSPTQGSALSQENATAAKISEPIVLSSDDEESENISRRCSQTVFRRPPRGSTVIQGLPSQRPVARISQISNRRSISKLQFVQDIPPLVPAPSIHDDDCSTIEVAFSTLHCGGYHGKSNGEIMIEKQKIIIPLQDASEEMEVLLSFNRNDLVRYSVWEQNQMEEEELIFRDDEDPYPPAVLLFFVSETAAAAVQSDLCRLGVKRNGATKAGKASPFILLTLAYPLEGIKGALLRSVLDIECLNSMAKEQISWNPASDRCYSLDEFLCPILSIEESIDLMCRFGLDSYLLTMLGAKGSSPVRNVDRGSSHSNSYKSPATPIEAKVKTQKKSQVVEIDISTLLEQETSALKPEAFPALKPEISMVIDLEASLAPEADASPAPASAPAPAPDVSPAPEADTSPAPEVNASPAPEAAPAADASPAPEAAPAADASPTPEVDVSPTPEADASPGPEADASPTSEVDASPTSEGDVSPAPEGDASLAPEAAPEADASPAPEADASPAPEVDVSLTPELDVYLTLESDAFPTLEPDASSALQADTSPGLELDGSLAVELESLLPLEPEAFPPVEPEASPAVEPEASLTVEPEASPTEEPEALPTAEPKISPLLELKVTQEEGTKLTPKDLKETQDSSCERGNELAPVYTLSHRRIKGSYSVSMCKPDSKWTKYKHLGLSRRLIQFPPPPQKGGITVTMEDLQCLDNGQFLNDVIIDFYLKYLLQNASASVAERTHIFSSFFYKQLTRRDNASEGSSSEFCQRQKRHQRVKTWTRHVDIFKKDFLFVPVNQEAHWYLVVICFPGLDEPKFEAKSQDEAEESHSGEEAQGLENSNDTTDLPPSLSRSSTVNTQAEKAQENSTKDFIHCPVNCTELTCQAKTVCKRPCILIMDSLKLSLHERVFKLLRDYLQSEWEVRRGSSREFGPDQMKSSHCKVPLQDNSSDCGLYLLQYVESFLKDPVVHFELPLCLERWFPRQQVRRKRDDIRNLILYLYRLQNLNT